MIQSDVKIIAFGTCLMSVLWFGLAFRHIRNAHVRVRNNERSSPLFQETPSQHIWSLLSALAHADIFTKIVEKIQKKIGHIRIGMFWDPVEFLAPLLT